MKFSFATKIPLWERLKLLWYGGLFVSIDYKGQHEIATANFEVIQLSEVTGNIEKEK